MNTSNVDNGASRVVTDLAHRQREGIESVARAVGMTRDTMYRRLRVGGWKASELAALAEHFGVDVFVFFRDPALLWSEDVRASGSTGTTNGSSLVNLGVVDRRTSSDGYDADAFGERRHAA